MHPASADRNRARLVPDRPFPPYSFVPGQAPHPTSDPAGHSYGTEPAPAEPLTAQGWRANRTYLYGIDLFDGGYYWESHVEFESLWLACGRRGVVAAFLKGLIKLAAAGVKHREGSPQGVRSHACRAAELWRQVSGELPTEVPFLGFRLRDLIELAEAVCTTGWPEEPPLLGPLLQQEGRLLPR